MASSCGRGGVRAVKRVAEVKAGDKMRVQAGTSGSGSMQIQVATQHS